VSRRRAPRPISRAVSAAVEGVEPATLLAAVQSAWPLAVGEAIAREASPVAERDGVVTVACRSATWAQELELLARRIREQLQAELPAGSSLEALRFTATADPD
jgi:predicted nucleic acid-binding Zn ribbon protein